MRLSNLALLLFLAATLSTSVQTAFAEKQETSQLTVRSQLVNGHPIEGKFTELAFGQTSVSSGFTPATFSLSNGESYRLGIADYQAYVFDHWLDTGSSDRWRVVILTEDVELVAVYAIQSAGGSEQTTIAEDEVGQGEIDSNRPVTTPRGSNKVYMIFYAPIVEAIAGYDLDKIPEAEQSFDYTRDCLTYVGFVHMRELVRSDLNALQQSWVYTQLKSTLDEHFSSVGVC